METTYHIPVLLTESVDGLAISEGKVFVDVTFGGGGHSREILSRLGNDGQLYSFDQDADAEANASVRREDGVMLAGDERWTFVRSNFRYLKNWMRYYGCDGVDGILADLGVSSHHFDDESRGFSFRFDSPLDMRMNKRGGITAADVVNDYDEERLADIIYLYGELKQSRRIAKEIVKARAEKRIATTHELMNAVQKCFPQQREKKDITRLFQALRIEVNKEMDALREMLTAATEVLKPGGRLVVITYHSLEDRMVKNIMKTGNVEGKMKQDYEIFNIGTGRPVSVYELVTAFENVNGVKLNYRYVDRRPGDIMAIWADTQLANEELGWKAVRSVEETLASAWAWEKHLAGK